MQDLFYSFDPGTSTTRAPMPTDFRHLLGWAEKLERFLTIHTHEEMININEQLNQTLNLQVSNIISRVIAQLIGLTDLGWRTIKATPEGALKVAIDGLLSDTRTLKYAPFRSNSIDPIEIVGATAGQKIHVVNLVFTVTGAVAVILYSGTDPISGAMDFGDTGEPKGAVIPLGLGPIVCRTGEAFNIDLDAAVYISGFCTYYKQLA
ncbi:hypothetical protein ES703_19469 [subsurface metagenome]